MTSRIDRIAVIGVVLTCWMLVAARVDGDGAVSPPRGAVPWAQLD